MPIARSRYLAWLCATSLLFVLSSAGSSQATEFVWGVNGHPFTAYPGISFEEQIDKVAELKLTSYRVNISNTGAADSLAKLLRIATSRGVTVLPVITPDLDLETMSEADLYQSAFNLAVALGSRFKREISVWELGNELENFAVIKACEMQDDGVQYNCSWGPAGGTNRLHYFGPRWKKVSSVLKGLSDGIHSVDPSLRRAIGTAGWGHTGAFDRMLDDGIKWEITVWHHYKGDPAEALKQLATLNRPIWITEFNNPMGSEHGEQAQANGITEMMRLIKQQRELYNIEAAFIYELYDEPYWGGTYEAVMGLISVGKTTLGSWAAGSPKAAYHAVKDFIASDDLRLTARSERTSATPVTQSETLRNYTVATKSPQTGCAVRQLDMSNRHSANHVAYAFCLFYRRLPSPTEQHKWVGQIRAGLNHDDLMARLRDDSFTALNMRSSEVSHGTFVKDLYRSLLLREADGAGLKVYTEQLANGTLTRKHVYDGIVTSSEFRQRHAPLFSPVSTTIGGP